MALVPPYSEARSSSTTLAPALAASSAAHAPAIPNPTTTTSTSSLHDSTSAVLIGDGRSRGMARVYGGTRTSSSRAATEPQGRGPADGQRPTPGLIDSSPVTHTAEVPTR